VRHRKKYVAAGCILVVISIWLMIRPSNDRDWSKDQAILSSAEIAGNTVTIRNVRNFHYRTTQDYDIAYEDRSYNLADLESLWFVMEPFSSGKGAAHTFLSFGFNDGRFLGISIEIRKEKGESFSWFWGLLKRYELMYVIGDERDLIGLRANMRHDDVFLYLVRASKENIRKLFLSMLERSNHLREYPEFYNTITNTCTTNIVEHIRSIAPKSIPWNIAILFPANSDRFAYDLGLLDTTLSFEQARSTFRINALAQQYADDPAFSLRIRGK
jgi:hypothetical protein